MKSSVIAAVSALVLLACDPGKKLPEQCDAAIAQLPSEPPEFGDTTTIPPHRAPWDAAYEACRTLAESESKLADQGKTRMQEIHGKQDKIEAVLKKRREARWKDEQETRQLILNGLRRRIQPRWGAFTNRGEPDSHCTSEGKPPYMLTYEGGTYEENEQVAFADKCVHAFYVGINGPKTTNFNQFCCPQQPRP